MNKLRATLLLILVLLVPSLIPLVAQENDQALATPAALLPPETYLYVEMDGEQAPEKLDTILSLFAPEDAELIPLAALLWLTPYADVQRWLGDRVAVAVFPPYTPNKPSLLDSIPTAALILQVGDERAADKFIEDLGFVEDWNFWQGGTIRIWRNPSLITFAIMRVDGYMVLGEARGIEHIAKTIFHSSASLAEDADFMRLQESIGSGATAWIYHRKAQRGFALTVDEDSLSLETARIAEAPDSVANPLTMDAIEGVPNGALLVDAGMNLDIPLQHGLDTLDSFVADIAASNESLNGLPLQLNALLRTALGVDVQDDLIPLFDGGYAFYVARAPDDAESMNAGFILAPQNTGDVPFTIARLTNRLEQNLGLSIEITGQLQYTLPILSSDLVYGFAEDRLYIGTDTGAESITAALDGSSANLSNDARWRRAFDNSPEGTQHLTYINLSGIADTLKKGLLAENDSPMLDGIFTYLERFESLIIYQQDTPDGLQTTRYTFFFTE